jgi:hypothetical protein
VIWQPQPARKERRLARAFSKASEVNYLSVPKISLMISSIEEGLGSTKARNVFEPVSWEYRVCERICTLAMASCEFQLSHERYYVQQRP